MDYLLICPLVRDNLPLICFTLHRKGTEIRDTDFIHTHIISVTI